MSISREEAQQILDALLPHKSKVLRWVTPTDAAITLLQSRLAEVEQELPTGECFKSYGALCARCGHDEFVLPAAPQGAPHD